MSDLTWEEDGKIPFDSEPIERNPSREYRREVREKRRGNGIKINPIWYVFIAVVIGAFAVLSYYIVNMNGEIAELKSERSNYTMNISSSGGNTAYASAKGMLSTVSISASSTNNGGSPETFFSSAMSSRGSGIILEVNKETGDAYIITNYHVVCSASTLKPFNYRWVLLWDSIVPISAVFVGGSSTYDIAVLKIEGSDEIRNSACTGASIGRSSQITVGEAVVAVGNSMARNLRITSGVISKEEDPMGSVPYNMYIEHSADVNSGNSGGGLYDANGELIGIVNAKFRDVNETTGELLYNEVIHGMNYAIPSEIAVSVAKNIIRNNGSLLKPNLGLTLGSNYTYNIKNYVINEDGCGYTTYDLVITKATGKFWVNDKLISMSYEFAGKEVIVELNRQFSLDSNIYNLSKGDKVKFVVERGGGQTEFEITIDTTTGVS